MNTYDKINKLLVRFLAERKNVALLVIQKGFIVVKDQNSLREYKNISNKLYKAANKLQSIKNSIKNIIPLDKKVSITFSNDLYYILESTYHSVMFDSWTYLKVTEVKSGIKTIIYNDEVK